jgi:hypothetical protein
MASESAERREWFDGKHDCLYGNAESIARAIGKTRRIGNLAKIGFPGSGNSCPTECCLLGVRNAACNDLSVGTLR